MSLNRQERRRAERMAAKAAKKATAGHGAVRDGTELAIDLLAVGQLQEAERVLRAVVASDPDDTHALVLLSKSLRRQGALDEAVAYARRAITRDARSVPAHVALGEALRVQDRVVEAVRSLEHAIELSPTDAAAHHACGSALIDLGELDDAIEHLERAWELAPDWVGYANSLGVALSRVGRFEEALPLFDEVLEHDARNAQVHFNRAFCLLALGRLAEGWADYEYGFAANSRKPNRTFPVPRWDGNPLPQGRRLLIWREQGLGDEVRVASCYPDVLERAEHVTIEAEPRLVTLFRRSFPTATVRPPTDAPDGSFARGTPDFDLHTPAGALPGFFRQRLEDFPRERTYLVADPRKREDFGRRLAALGPGLRVGVCWRSMQLAVSRLQWYTTLEEWEPVFTVGQATFVNLQYGDPALTAAELRAHEERTGRSIVAWDDVDYTDDLESVAALIDSLDLVVGVSTSVSLLAGALGKPVIQIGLPDPMQFGVTDHDPWLPTIQPLKRKAGESWTPLMHQVAERVRTAAGSGQ